MSTLLLVGGSALAQKPLQYPAAHRVDTVDRYFGTAVPDPYRWLEDDNSDETARWQETFIRWMKQLFADHD